MASGRNFCCSDFDLTENFVFDCNSVVQRLKNGSKACVKVCTSWQVSLQPHKASILARIRVERHLVLRKVNKKVNNRDEVSFLNMKSTFSNVNRPNPALAVGQAYRLNYLSQNASLGTAVGSSYQPDSPGLKMI